MKYCKTGRIGGLEDSWSATPLARGPANLIASRIPPGLCFFVPSACRLFVPASFRAGSGKNYQLPLQQTQYDMPLVRKSKNCRFSNVFFGVSEFDHSEPLPRTLPQETFIKVSKTEGTRIVRLVAQDSTRPGPKARQTFRGLHVLPPKYCSVLIESACSKLSAMP